MVSGHYLNQFYLSFVTSSDIHLKATLHEIITKITFTYLKFHSNFPGANELIPWTMLQGEFAVLGNHLLHDVTKPQRSQAYIVMAWWYWPSAMIPHGVSGGQIT